MTVTVLADLLSAKVVRLTWPRWMFWRKPLTLYSTSWAGGWYTADGRWCSHGLAVDLALSELRQREVVGQVRLVTGL